MSGCLEAVPTIGKTDCQFLGHSLGGRMEAASVTLCEFLI
jgi:hypothetical protein